MKNNRFVRLAPSILGAPCRSALSRTSRASPGSPTARTRPTSPAGPRPPRPGSLRRPEREGRHRTEREACRLPGARPGSGREREGEPQAVAAPPQDELRLGRQPLRFQPRDALQREPVPPGPDRRQPDHRPHPGGDLEQPVRQSGAEPRVGGEDPPALHDRRAVRPSGREARGLVEFPAQAVPDAVGAERVRRREAVHDPAGRPAVHDRPGQAGHPVPGPAAERPPPRAEPAEHLAPEVPHHQPVPLLARRGVPFHQLHHLGDLREPLQGMDRGPAGVADALAVGEVVAVVVGDHRDDLGVEVGERGEGLVLAGAQVLGEAQAEALDQVAPEELLRREGVVDAVPVEVGPVPVAGERRPRHPAPADPGHPAEHHVGAVALGRRHQALQRLGPQVVVGVEEEDVAPPRQVEPGVARPSGPSGGGLVHRSHLRMPHRVVIEHGSAAVRRSVVDRDDLQPLQPDALPDHRVEALPQVRLDVVHGHDHRDHGNVHALPRLPPGQEMPRDPRGDPSHGGIGPRRVRRRGPRRPPRAVPIRAGRFERDGEGGSGLR